MEQDTPVGMIMIKILLLLLPDADDAVICNLSCEHYFIHFHFILFSLLGIMNIEIDQYSMASSSCPTGGDKH